MRAFQRNEESREDCDAIKKQKENLVKKNYIKKLAEYNIKFDVCKSETPVDNAMVKEEKQTKDGCDDIERNENEAAAIDKMFHYEINLLNLDQEHLGIPDRS